MKPNSVLGTYRHNIVIMALFFGYTVHVNTAKPNKTDFADDIEHSAIDIINGEAFTEYSGIKLAVHGDLLSRAQMRHWFVNEPLGDSEQLSAHRIPASVPA